MVHDKINGEISSHEAKKLHLGCGTILLKNWTNIGFWNSLNLGEFYEVQSEGGCRIFLNYDLKNGIPAQDNEVDAIYHCHMLEHLSYMDGIKLLKDAYRVLAPGAVHRIVVPDLRLFAEEYLKDESLLLKKYRTEVLDEKSGLYKTNGSIFMGMLHNHDHKMGWDFETLKYILEEIGFKKVERMLYQQSILEDINEIEAYSPLRALESLCVECVK